MSREELWDLIEISDLEALVRKARALEGRGLLGEALMAWRAVLRRIDRSYLPAWEASTRILRKLRADAHPGENGQVTLRGPTP